jgi:cell division protein FtsI/penicillin-binding protein 2
MTRTHNRGAHAGRPAPLLGVRASRGAAGDAPAGGARAGRSQAGRRRAGASEVNRSRTRSVRVRIVVACAATALVLTGVGLGWAAPAPSAEPTVQAFLLDWETGQYSAAAALTTGAPAVVTAALSGAYHQLGAEDVNLGMAAVTQHGDNADATFNASVDLGHNGAPWDYQGGFALHRAGSGWKVVWSPAVIVPGLRPGLRLAVVSTMPPRAQLLDAEGAPLAPLSMVVTVGVIPGRLANPAQTADGLARATGLPSSQILAWITEAPAAGFLELARFDQAQYAQLSSQLTRVPGLIIEHQQMRLFDSIAGAVTGSVGTETTAALQQEGVTYRPGTTVGLSGLQQAFQRQLVGSPTTQVVEENSAGQVASVLKTWTGHAGSNVTTTINARIQDAADAAAATVPGSAAIVAVSASTGQILAVADRDAPGEPDVDPLNGRYQPGQAFTIVSTEALLASGFNTGTPIPCIGSNQVGGQNFTNNPAEPDLGPEPPFSTDFANACGTAFAGLSLRLSARNLQDAASGFGFGADWELPLDSFTGAMAPPGDQAELAADSIGGGSVQVSPLDMALAAAVVESGTWHAPSLVTSPADPPSSPRVPFGSSVVSSLRTLMRSTVTAGAGQAANATGGPVYGQVGSVPLGTDGLQAAWFVGFQGNVAFAVLQLTRSPSVSAAPLAGRFLSDIKAGT